MKELYHHLLRNQQILFEQTPDLLIRDMIAKIHWGSSRILLIWQRWVGKSTLLLQHCRKQNRAIYFSADHHSITSIGLYTFIDFLVSEAKETTIYIDEIFRYPSREQELKNCFDNFPHVQFIMTWSNSLQAFSKTADFVRRVDIYHLDTLTFAEYMQLHTIHLPRYQLDEIITWTIDPRSSTKITKTLFDEYLAYGSYPMISSLPKEQVIARLYNVLDEIILQDIGSVIDIHTSSLFSMKKLFYFIWSTPPSDLSISWLSQKLQVNRASLETVLHLLSHIGVIHLIPRFWNISDTIRKEYKILLGNPMLYSLYNSEPWSVRESFFVAMVKQQGYEIYTPRHGDYVLTHNDTHYYIEIGGKNKTAKQLTEWTSKIVVQDVLTSNTAIPLWQFWLIGK